MNHQQTEDQRVADFIGSWRRPPWWRAWFSEAFFLAVVVLMTYVLWRQVTSRKVQTVFNVTSCAPCTS